jgi:hypothetical protein
MGLNGKKWNRGAGRVKTRLTADVSACGKPVHCLRERSEFAFANIHSKAVATALRSGFTRLVYPQRKYLNLFDENSSHPRSVVRLL